MFPLFMQDQDTFPSINNIQHSNVLSISHQTIYTENAPFPLFSLTKYRVLSTHLFSSNQLSTLSIKIKIKNKKASTLLSDIPNKPQSQTNTNFIKHTSQNSKFNPLNKRYDVYIHKHIYTYTERDCSFTSPNWEIKPSDDDRKARAKNKVTPNSNQCHRNLTSLQFQNSPG